MTRRRLAPGTMRAYERIVTACDEHDPAGWLQREGATRSASWARQAGAALRWGIGRGEVTCSEDSIGDVVDELVRARWRPPRQAKPLDRRVETRILVGLSADTDRKRAIYDRALLLVMRDTLARRGECARLRWADWRGEWMALTVTKGGTPALRMAPITGRTASALQELRELRGPDSDGDSIFSVGGAAIARRIRRMGEAVGVEGLSGHSARRGMAIDLAVSGESLVEIQHAGGWSSPAMPGHYALTPTSAAVQRLRAAEL